MRRHLLILCVFLTLILTGFYFLLNTTWFLSRVVPLVAGRELQKIGVESFQTGHQSYQYPATLVLQNVDMVLRWRERRIHAHAEKITLPHVLIFQKTIRRLDILLQGFDAQEGGMKTQGADLQLAVFFDRGKFKKMDGMVRAPALTITRYQWKNFLARLKGSPGQLQIFEATAEAYDGKWQGQATLQENGVFSYILWLEFFGVNPESLREIQESMFSRIQGELQGSIRINGGQDQIDLLAIQAQMPKGGEVHSSLIKKAAAELKDSAQREQWLALADSQETLAVDDAALSVDGIDNRQAVISFRMGNRSLGLNLMDSVNKSFPEGLHDIIWVSPPPED